MLRQEITGRSIKLVCFVKVGDLFLFGEAACWQRLATEQG